MTKFVPRNLVKKILLSGNKQNLLEMTPEKLTIMFIDIEVQ